MYFEVMADVTDNIKTLGGLKLVKPNVQSYNAAVARINAQKRLPTYIKLIAERTANVSGTEQEFEPFIFFDTNEVSGVENGANVTTSTDYPGGMDALVARLKDGRVHFAGIRYKAADTSVFDNLELQSFVTDGVNKIFRNIQTEFIDAGQVNDGQVDATLRSVAIFGELSYDTGLIGKIAENQRFEMMLQVLNY